MSSSKKIFFILISAISAAAVLSSCGQAEVRTADIAQMTTRAPVNYKTVEIVNGDIVREINSQATLDYDVETIYFTGDDVGKLGDLHFFNRQAVSKGDLLMEIELDVVYFTDELEKLRLNILNAERFLELEKESMRDNIAESAERLLGADPYEAEINKLRIEKAKLEYEYYVYDAELRINGWKKDMAEIEKKLEGVKIYAPIDGVLGNITTLSRGEAVMPGTQLMQIYYNDDLRLRVNADPANLRFNMEVTVTVANDTTYRGIVISDPTAANQDGGLMDFMVRITERPGDYGAFLNLLSSRRLTVTGKSVNILDVPVMPYNAVYNENNKRYVFLIEDNIMKKRYVQLGLFNFQSAEIVSGLRLGDRVLE